MAERGHREAIVIGAGPYGLSVAAHLRAANVPVRVIGHPMSSWREEMPAGMLLKSTPLSSDLSAPVAGYGLRDYCLGHGVEPLADHQAVPADLFVNYGQWFQREWVPDIEQARVEVLRRRPDGFEVVLDTGERLVAGSVAVATGQGPFAYLPPQLSAPEMLTAAKAGAPAPVSHSSRHRHLSGFSGTDVIVVGAGQSALETAALLLETGARVTVVARRQVAFNDPPKVGGRLRIAGLVRPDSPLGDGWPYYLVSRSPYAFSHLPARVRLAIVRRLLGPAGAWWLRERVLGRVPLRAGQRIVAARTAGGRVVLHLWDRKATTSTLSADHVIAATGYRVDLDRLDFIEPETRAAIARTGRSPRLGPSFESSVPGLFFAGLSAAATFGPLLRFVAGTRFAATRISAAVTAGSDGRVRV
jgi:cation diffusion facilitator CzcD-associated flavoprotein CzcO